MESTIDHLSIMCRYKMSGIHRDKGEACLDNYLEIKTVTMPGPK